MFILIQSSVCERIMQQLGQQDMDHAERQASYYILNQCFRL